MQLEDHIGDIIGKARKGLKIEIHQAAEIANLSSIQYSRFEEEGIIDPELNLVELGKLLEIRTEKLSVIADGWEPSTSICMNKTVEQITTNEGMEVHCYLAWDEETLEAALFDTGWNPKPILALIENYDLNLKHLFITHTHHDHIAALTTIRKKFNNIELHSSSSHAPERQRNRPTEVIKIGKLQISSRGTPGHADDGATYVIDNFPNSAPKVAIVGDAIFAGSMGGAPHHYQLAREKVQSQILSLPPETILCPGHGPITTVAEQHLVNPFF